jgi:hypothetical protein
MNTANDCGVICLQRMFKYAFYGDPSATLPENLQSTTSFRCFILFKILQSRQSLVSPYILYKECQEDTLVSKETAESVIETTPTITLELQSLINQQEPVATDDSISQNQLNAVEQEINKSETLVVSVNNDKQVSEQIVSEMNDQELINDFNEPSNANNADSQNVTVHRQQEQPQKRLLLQTTLTYRMMLLLHNNNNNNRPIWCCHPMHYNKVQLLHTL